jgi:hypothetical protein
MGAWPAGALQRAGAVTKVGTQSVVVETAMGAGAVRCARSVVTSAGSLAISPASQGTSSASYS